MLIKFAVTLDSCLNNIIYTENGFLKNSRDNTAVCSLWMGEGTVCLQMDGKSGRVEGLCGSLQNIQIKEEAFVPLQSFDGAVYATSKLPAGTIIGYKERGVGYDRNRQVLWFGNPHDGDIIVRVSNNLIISLKDELICGVVVDNIKFE